MNVHDFADRRLGEYAKAIPYGVYDIANDEGWVNVGDVADTAEFAVESIRRWWNTLGRSGSRTPRPSRSPPTAGVPTATGSAPGNGTSPTFAAETGLTITVLHYPPGTSKWNKIEHRLFSFISMNWRGRPLTDIRTIVELIAATTTRSGLTVQAVYDPNWYPTGTKITDTE